MLAVLFCLSSSLDTFTHLRLSLAIIQQRNYAGIAVETLVSAVVVAGLGLLPAHCILVDMSNSTGQFGQARWGRSSLLSRRGCLSRDTGSRSRCFVERLRLRQHRR